MAYCITMPIYEYRRQDGTTFEVMQKFSDETLTVDPDTGAPVTKVLHAPAIHFKGKGFHNTDYGTRNRNRELEKSAESGADKHDAKMADKAADSKKAADTASSSSSGNSASSTPAPSTSSSSSSSSSDKKTSGGSDKAQKPKAA
ncbi:MAG: zinc ribbon protein [Solirubrobacterales bacterium]|nr:zinc ribbon protein [Solirubrobacterales bacterium]